MKAALLEEIARTEQPLVSATPPLVDVMSDARHGCRKNSFHSDIVTLGQRTHKVVNYQHVTKDDERSSQKHEAYGTKKMYADMLADRVHVRAHAHDRNASVSKYIESDQPGTLDQLDTWHASKEVRSATKKIVKGPKKNISKTWHPQLEDKAASIKTHTYHCIKNCGGSTDRIKDGWTTLCATSKISMTTALRLVVARRWELTTSSPRYPSLILMLNAYSQSASNPCTCTNTRRNILSAWIPTTLKATITVSWPTLTSGSTTIPVCTACAKAW